MESIESTGKLNCRIRMVKVDFRVFIEKNLAATERKLYDRIREFRLG
jgi:hypothetical protein